MLVEFSQEETALLLRNSSPSLLPAAALEKLNRLELGDLFGQLPRNLGIFFREA